MWQQMFERERDRAYADRFCSQYERLFTNRQQSRAPDARGQTILRGRAQ